MFRDALANVSQTPPRLMDIAQIAAEAFASNKSPNSPG